MWPFLLSQAACGLAFWRLHSRPFCTSYGTSDSEIHSAREGSVRRLCPRFPKEQVMDSVLKGRLHSDTMAETNHETGSYFLRVSL